MSIDIKAQLLDILNESSLGKKKPKKHIREAAGSSVDLASFDIKKLTLDQVNQALDNAGYTDKMVSAKFSKMSSSATQYPWVYSIEDEEGETGTIFIGIGKNGLICAEY